MEIIRGRLSAKDYGNPSLRYVSETDEVQFTPDNGTTWVDAPSADPRHSDIYRYPPLATVDPPCDAAADMVKWLKDFIDQATTFLGDGATAFTLLNFALGLFAEVFPPDLFIVAISELCSTLFGAGAAALLAAFTSDQWDLLLCIFMCNIEADGSVTASDLAAITSEITVNLNTTAALILNFILFIQGEVGLSNAGTLGGEAGDCSDCECGWIGCVDFRTGLHDWNILNFGTANQRGEYVPGQGILTTGTGDSPTEVYLYKTFTAVNLSRITIHGHHFMSGSPSGVLDLLVGGTVVAHTIFNPPGVDGEGNDWSIAWYGNETPDQMNITITEPGGGGFVWFEFRGREGDVPEWLDTCPED
jgi:hypothetical protein